MKMNKNFLKRLYYPSLVIFVLVIFFIILENKFPYYFLQDDNRTLYLPLHIHNYRNIFVDREIPFFNFHQFLGTPLMANGFSSSLYPLVYISIFVSNIFMGHYFASIDIIVFIHLMIGSLGLFYLLKYIGLDNKSSLFGAITFPLTSFVIYMSNAWWLICGIMAYFPWMMLLSLKLHKNYSPKVLVALVIIRLLFFYIGHIEFFIYGVLFEIITFSLILLGLKLNDRNEKILKTIKSYFLSYIFTLIFSLPLLLPMWNLMSISYNRDTKIPYEMFCHGTYTIDSFLGGLFYYPLLKETLPVNIFTGKIFNYLSHTGYIAIIFFISSIVIIIVYFIKKNFSIENKGVYIYSFLIVFTITFLWITGIISSLIYQIPFLNRFQGRLKVNIITNFYIVCVASIVLHFFINKIPFSKIFQNIIFMILLLANILNLFYVHLKDEQKSYRIILDKVPQKEPLKNKIKDGRIIPVGIDTDKFIAGGICANYATLWELFQLGGYQTLITKENKKASLGLNYMSSYINPIGFLPIDHFRIWGIKWYILNKDDSNYTKYREFLNKNEIVIKFDEEANKRAIFVDDKALPLVFWNDSHSSAGLNKNIKYNIKGNSIYLETESKKNDYIVINFLHNNFFKAKMDKIETPIFKNNLGQMAIYVPEGKHSIIIEYKDPYFFLGLTISTLFLITMLIKRFPKKRKYISRKLTLLTLAIITTLSLIAAYGIISIDLRNLLTRKNSSSFLIPKNKYQEKLIVENLIKNYENYSSLSNSSTTDKLLKLLVEDSNIVARIGLLDLNSAEFLEGRTASNIGKNKPNIIKVSETANYEDVMTEAICGLADTSNTNSANPTKIIFNLNEKQNLILFIGLTGAQQFEFNDFLIEFFSDKLEKQKLYTTKATTYFLISFSVPKEYTKVGDNFFQLSVPNNAGKNGWTQIDFITILSTKKDELMQIIQ